MENERPNGRAVASSAASGKLQILARSAFAALPAPSRDALLGMSTLARLPRRRALVVQGEPPETLFVLGSGRVKVERRSGERQVSLGHRGPGHLVGETALAGAEALTESASVLDDAEALAVPVVPLRAALDGDAPLRHAVAAAILRQFRETEQRLMGLLLHGVEVRLAAFLVDAGERWGRTHPDGELVSAPFTHAEIAQLIGSTRETVTLVLGRLRRDGLIAFDHRRVVIRDRARLAARAEAAAA
jgi:CRP-like cAMP-binding protein